MMAAVTQGSASRGGAAGLFATRINYYSHGAPTGRGWAVGGGGGGEEMQL